MIPPMPGPKVPPPGARTVKINVWSDGVGTFWQLRDVIGMIWDRMPDWGPTMMEGVMPSAYWVLGNEEVAKHHFDVLESHYK